ncbi:MAG: zinc-binding alcohol dehydrogenase [Hyphomicrobiales bacterium]|nr:zinc-binding alcohol dehydrogenase [Hyphomicrobiales bacterium]
MPATALWYVAKGRAQLQEEPTARPAAGEVRVRARFGAISRGTERLVFEGRVPHGEHERMRAPFMAGSFPFPVKYGYSVVGSVEEGVARGLQVFVLHPHQSEFIVPETAVVVVPARVPLPRAVLAANMETALNALWDAAPGPCDRIAVVGGGVVGLLIARLCVRMAATQVTVIDVMPSRAALATALGAAFADPDRAPENCDLVFHASASAAGLATALRIAGDEAAVIELSWYGSGEVAAPLGEAFHSRRLRLIASQVGKVAASHRPRWSAQRRLSAALDLLDDPALDVLLASPVDFETLPERLPTLLAANGDGRCPLIRYP